MIRLLVIAVFLALALAKPELYKETEDFQYSRSSSDEGSKSGFYGAQRGNMGGNFEKAHNMDGLAQHQMSGLVRTVDGELGDGYKLRTGSVYSAANSRGIYGSGNYDLSNLHGRNFEETESFGGSHSSRMSQSSGFRSQAIGESGAGRSSEHAHSSGFRGYTDREESQQFFQSDHLKSMEDNLHRAHEYDYGNQATQYSSSGLQSHRSYDQSNANVEHSGVYGAESSGRYLTATPVRVVVRPGKRLTVPFTAQNYDGSRTASSFDIDRTNINKETELLGSNGQIINYKPSITTNPKHYESSYSYHKAWEKHDTHPVSTPVVIPTENPFFAQSEEYNKKLMSNSESAEKNSNFNLYNSRASNAYTANSKSVASTRSRYQAGFNAQQSNSASMAENTNSYTAGGQSSSIDTNTNGYNVDSSNTLSTSSADGYNIIGGSQLSTANANEYNTDSRSRLSSSSANEYNARTRTQQSKADSGSKVAADSSNIVELLSTKPKSYHSSYSYHKAWERQGDPYVIKPASGAALDGLTSQKLISASSNQGAYSHHYGSHYKQSNQQLSQNGFSGDCDEEGRIRVARSYDPYQRTFQNMYQGQEDYEQQSQSHLENLGDSGQETQKFNKLEDFNQQSRNQWDNMQDLSQQPQEKFSELEELGQHNHKEWANMYDFNQQSEEKFNKLEDLGQQTQNQWDNMQDISQQTQEKFDKLEDLGQQTQNHWGNIQDISQQTQETFNKLEDLGQQTQNQWDNMQDISQQTQEKFNKLEDLGQQTQNQWDNMQDISQQTQEKFNKLEDLGQQTQNQWDNIQDISQQTQDKLNKLEDLGQQIHNPWDNIQDISQQTPEKLNKQEDLGQQTQNQWDNMQDISQQTQEKFNKLEDLGQQTQNQCDNTQDINQQTQEKFNKLEDLGQQIQNPWDNIQDISQQTQEKFNKQEDLGQQTQNEWDNTQDINQQTQEKFNKLEDLGQQIQNPWDNIRDISQQTQEKFNKQEDLGQQTQNQWDNTQDINQQTQEKFNKLEDLGQQIQNPWDNIRDISQQTQEKFNKQEDLGQQTQNQWDNTQDINQQTQEKFNKLEDLGQQIQNPWDNTQDLSQQTQEKFNKLEDLGQQNQNHLKGLDQQPISNVDQQIQSQGVEVEEQKKPKFWTDNYNQPLESIHNIQQSQNSKFDVHNPSLNNQQTYNKWNTVESTSTNEEKQFWKQYNSNLNGNVESSFDTTYKNENSYNNHYHNSQKQTEFHTQSEQNVSPLGSFWDKLNGIATETLSNDNDEDNNTQKYDERNSTLLTQQQSVNNSDFIHYLQKQQNSTSSTNTIEPQPTSSYNNKKIQPNDVGRGDIGPEDNDLVPETFLNADQKVVEDLGGQLITKNNRQLEKSLKSTTMSTDINKHNNVNYQRVDESNQAQTPTNSIYGQHLANREITMQYIPPNPRTYFQTDLDQENIHYKPMHKEQYTTKHQIEDFRQQTKELPNLSELESYGQQLQSGWQPEHNFKLTSENYSDSSQIKDYHSLKPDEENNNSQKLETLNNEYNYKKINELQKVDMVIPTLPPPESETEKPGFWKSVGSKLTNAKNKVYSWFSSS